MPISYMNTTAGLKAFTGRNGGLICTSSNAVAALKWAFARREKVFFFPDENLGYNTGIGTFGVNPEEMVLWDFSRDGGGLTEEQIEKARDYPLEGPLPCPHQFHRRTCSRGAGAVSRSEGRSCIRSARHEVVELADGVRLDQAFWSSTVEQAPAGFDNRDRHRDQPDQPDGAWNIRDKKIFELSGQTCPVCANMYRTTLNDLVYTP